MDRIKANQQKLQPSLTTPKVHHEGEYKARQLFSHYSKQPVSPWMTVSMKVFDVKEYPGIMKINRIRKFLKIGEFFKM